MKRLISSLIIFVLCLTNVAANRVVWYNGHDHVTYSTQAKLSPVVHIALDMFSEDMRLVTGKRAVNKAGAHIEIYQLDLLSNKEFKKMQKRRLPFERIITHKETFYIGVHNGRIVVMGSDARGAAYGVLEMSRMAGVSPWVWWGDVRPQKAKTLALDERFETVQMPSVEYRGIFINDEDWSLRSWAKQRQLDRNGVLIGPRTYKKIFELMLRLRANTLWPAMHEGTTPFFKVRGNKEMADSCGIIIGTSHCEPMLCNNVGEWNEQQMGQFNYITNTRRIHEYWTRRVEETADIEAIYTLGMRGIHDGAMQGVSNLTEQVTVLQKVIADQRNILHKATGRKTEEIPQVFIPYKEVQEAFDNGLQIPDDVTLVWCDDNYGYLTRLPDLSQQTRRGGSGVYYHLSYWGRPHDYLWLSTTSPGLVCHQMKQAFNNGAHKLWIANVHDPKVAAYQLSLFLDMAWNINSADDANVSQHLGRWLAQQFGTTTAEQVLPVMKEFYHLTTIRRPEFMGWNQVELNRDKYERGISPVQNTQFDALAFGNELERYIEDFARLKNAVTAIEETVRPELKDAFFAAVKYPVFAAAAMVSKQLNAQEARHLARSQSFHIDDEALVSAASSIVAYKEIVELTDYYNNKLAGGKWKGLMSMAPRGLPVFAPPTLPDTLSEQEINDYAHAEQIDCTLDMQGCIARNACDYTSATEGIKTIELLGHSMKAVCLPKDGELVYQFESKKRMDALLSIGLIPTHPLYGGDARFSVSIDNGTPVVFNIKEGYRSEGWKENVLRNQVVKTTKIYVAWGKHTLRIKALDDNIIIDQWMIDHEQDRKFYMFPLQGAM